LEASVRVSADGYINISDPRRVRTPGYHDHALEPVPEEEAVAFLLSHTFRGHRRIVRPLSLQERKRIRLALWAGSLQERMTLMDRVWRAITERVDAIVDPAGPQLIQVVRCGSWAYPIYTDGDVTRVIPNGGMPLADVEPDPLFDFAVDRKTA
jgi:hypothetical protein